MIDYNLDLIILKNLICNKKHALNFVSECDVKLFSPEVWNFANLVVGHLKIYKELPTLRIITEKLSTVKNSTKQIENINKIWEQLNNVECDEKEYQHDLEKIKERFARKQISLIKEKLSLVESESLDVNKTILEIQKNIKSIQTINNAKSYDSKNVKDYLSTFVEKFKAKRTDPNFDMGIKTGYSFFDYATNGIKPADLVLIAGESGFGKSLFLNNIAIQVWLQKNTIEQHNFSEGKNIIYFSLEMPYEDCFNRFLSRLSGVPTRHIENPKFLSKTDFVNLKKALDFIDKYPYKFEIVDISDACANDLEMILSDFGEEFDSIFIDYLGIMKTNESSDEQDWLKQGSIAYEVRAIGRRRNKPIFSAVQLNRKSANKESSENIGLARLARSGTIATHATHVIQIENRQQEDNYSDLLYHLIKNRKGPKGKGVLLKNLACASLIDKEIGEESQYENYFQDLEDISEELEELDL